MTEAVRIDRDAFRRGVEDVMTLAPLREAVRSAASGVFLHKREASSSDTQTTVVKTGGKNERNPSTGK